MVSPDRPLASQAPPLKGRITQKCAVAIILDRDQGFPNYFFSQIHEINDITPLLLCRCRQGSAEWARSCTDRSHWECVHAHQIPDLYSWILYMYLLRKGISSETVFNSYCLLFGLGAFNPSITNSRIRPKRKELRGSFCLKLHKLNVNGVVQTV